MITRQTFEHIILSFAFTLVLITFFAACSDRQTYKAKVASCLASGGSELKCTGRLTGIDN